jgi:GNAT superfamily N-acetyltransferase
MHLAGRILNHTGIERQQIADIAGSSVRHIDDLRQIHAALIGGLFRIDAGHRGRYADLFEHHLFVVQHHPHISKQRIGLVQHRFIEAGLFKAEAVGFGTLDTVRDLAGVIGQQANLIFAWLLKDRLSARHGHAILVQHRKQNRGIGRRLPGGRSDAAKEKQPENHSTRTPETSHGFTAANPSILVG